MSNFSVYSCYNAGLSNDSITAEYWVIHEDSMPAALTTAVFTVAFIVLGLPGNTLIILSILCQHLYKEATHILLLSLAVTDLLLCGMVMPFTVMSGFAGGFILGGSDNARCKWCQTGIVFVTLCFFSLNVLALLSVDRFVFVKFPMKYHRLITAWRISGCILVLGILCVVVSIFPLFGFGDVWFHPYLATCTLNYVGMTQLTNNTNYLVFLAAITSLPLGVLVLTNVWVACIVQKHIRKTYTLKKTSLSSRDQVTTTIRNRLSKEKNHKQLQITRVFGAILLTNVITWLPSVCHILIVAISGNPYHPGWVYPLVYLSITSSAVCHPLLQASLIPDVRTWCKHLLTRVFCCCKSVSGKPTFQSSEAKADPQKQCLECFCCEVLSATVLPDTDSDGTA